MKFIHCADLHLDSKMQTHFSKEKAKERRDEILVTYQSMVSYAAENDVDVILIAGDLFDTNRVSATARNAVYQSILQNPQIQFYYLKGNHDADSFLGNLEQIPENLHLFDEQWTSYDLGENIILTGAEVPSEDSLVLDNEKFNVVTMHGEENVQGMRNKGIDYLALGHIHGYRMVQLDGRGSYCYPGCLEGRGFDECGEHGFVLMEIHGEERTYTHTFVPFAKRTLYEIAVDATDCETTDDVAMEIERALAESNARSKDLLRIVLTGAVDVESEISEGLLEKRLEGRFYHVQVKGQTTRKIDYQSYVLDESLKGEFVRSVMADDSLSEEDKALVVRYGIQVLAGEEI